MSILVYVCNSNNQIQKSAFDAVSYAAQYAEKSGAKVTAVCVGEASNVDDLGKYGADKVVQLNSDALHSFQPSLFAKGVEQVAQQEGSNLVIFSHDLSGKAIAPIVAVKLNAGIVTGAVALPETNNGFTVKKAVFSGKAYANMKINSEVKVISVLPNSIEKIEFNKTVSIESTNVDLGSAKIKVIEQKMESADLPLSEAEKVVSAGRGLKGPENWGMVEELAKALGAATACSRPVADMDWRPHHEHVGQTGVAIRPNLYIAIGISGAIQHLAGVNQSKVIVVINTDAEAPFFKSADYGIVGDAFEVVPKLVEAAKNMGISAN